MGRIATIHTIPDRIYDQIYRILCIRYLFLAAIAWIWLHKETYNKYILYCGALFSFIYLLAISNGCDMGKFVYSGKWSSQNYPVYFWTYMLIQMLWITYRNTKPSCVKRLLCWMGRNSWEIFVMQMFVLGFFKLEMCHLFQSQAINQIAYILIGFITATLPVAFYQNIKRYA